MKRPTEIDALIAKLMPLATFTLEIEPEDDVQPEDQLDDAESVRLVRDQMRDGNEWAWFRAKVTCEVLGFEGTDFLGACSYASEADFRAPGGYFDDMKYTALREIAERVLPLYRALRPTRKRA
jgi:hypothetical protein